MAARHFLGAAAAGAISMYLLDPDHGRRRRAVMRDRVASGVSRLDDATSVASRDLRNRARGLAHEVRARFTREEVPDEILCERVRAQLGWAVSHPGAIEVSALSGRVTLSGAVLEREYVRLLRTVWAVRGVADVEDRLAVYESAAGISVLQGGGRARERRLGPWREHWSPGARVIMGAAGGALLLNALAGKRSALGLLGGLAGAALVARSSANMPIDRLVGVRPPSIELQKCIDVAAPIEHVFETFSQLERLPELMTHVREVHVRGDGTSQWVVDGPAGRAISWEAVTTRLEPDRLIAWRTLPGSAVDHSGLLRFEPTEGGTRIIVTMSYTPYGGAIGHAIARLFGTDPKSELNDDLMRMKVFLETGRRARDAAAAARH
ncbi:MAG: BON domain-containing protein [Proteobacteria bacterium]|nr:BON domain-containing protein [Pseudomonadota bacterium]